MLFFSVASCVDSRTVSLKLDLGAGGGGAADCLRWSGGGARCGLP